MLSARDLRVEEATPFAKRYAARWIVSHGILANRADDVRSDTLWVMVILAGEFDEKRGVPWMKFLASRIKHRLIDEIRTQHGRATAKGYEARSRISNATELPSITPTPERGYREVDDADELDSLLAPYSLRTQRILRARMDGWTLAEIGVKEHISMTRVHQLIREARETEGGLHVVRAAVAVAKTQGEL